MAWSFCLLLSVGYNYIFLAASDTKILIVVIAEILNRDLFHFKKYILICNPNKKNPIGFNLSNFFRETILRIFYYFVSFFCLAMVRKQEVQSLTLIPPIWRGCKLIFCRFKVCLLEWERIAPFVELRPHKSHFLAINFVAAVRPGSVLIFYFVFTYISRLW